MSIPPPKDGPASPEASWPREPAKDSRALPTSRSSKSPPRSSSSPFSAAPPATNTVTPTPATSAQLKPSAMESIETLRSGSDLNDRIAAANTLKFAISEQPLDPVILAVWHAGRDLIDPSKPSPARAAGWQLLNECVKHAPPTDLERRQQYFQTLTAPNNPENFHLQLAALIDLTKNGRNPNGFEEELLPLLNSWLRESYQTVRAARRRASSAISKGSRNSRYTAMITDEEQNFKQLLSLLGSVIKFSSKLSDNQTDNQDVISLIDDILEICNNTTVETDIKASIEIIDILSTFSSIPPERLKNCVHFLSSIFYMIHHLRKEAWHSISNILRSHNGQEMVRILLETLEGLSAENFKDKNKVREVRGSLIVLRKLFSKNGLRGYPVVSYTLLLDGLSETIKASPTARIRADILAFVNSLFHDFDGGLHQCMNEEEDWSTILNIALECCGERRENNGYLDGPVSEQLQLLIGHLEKFLKESTADISHRNEVIKFFAQTQSHLLDGVEADVDVDLKDETSQDISDSRDETSLVQYDISESRFGGSFTNPSYAESVFSKALSEEPAISRTSLVNVRSAKEEIVAFFLADMELRRIYLTAIHDPAVGGDRLERNFRRLLVDYSTELLAAAEIKVYREAAKMIRFNAPFISEKFRRHFELEPPIDSSGSVQGVGATEEETVGKRQMLNRYLEEVLRQQNNKSIFGGGIEPKPADESVVKADNEQEDLDWLSEAPSEPLSDETSIVTALDQVKEFLGSGSALNNLRIGLRNFVTPRLKQPGEKATDKLSASRNEPEAPHTTSTDEFSAQRAVKTFTASLPDLVNSLVDLLPSLPWEPPTPSGKDRVRWKCKCGTNLYDDFTELEPGSLKRVEAQLRAASSGDSHSSNQNSGNLAGSFSALSNQIKQMIQSMRRGSTNDDIPIPLRNDSRQNTNLATLQGEILHLLCCIHRGETGTILHQERISHVRTDRQLIMFLNEVYREQRSTLPWLRLRHVSKLHLTRFELDFSYYVQIHLHTRICQPTDCFCLPTVEQVRGNEYRCGPSPETRPKQIPVFGENYLTHYFNHPQCLDEMQTRIFAQLPKRACGKLAASHEESALGWGVYFEEGWHWRSIYFIVALLIFTASLVFGVVWSVMKADIQSAFAISSYWITLGSLLLGYMAVRSL